MPSNVSFFITRANESQHNQEIRGINDKSGIIKTPSKAEKSQKLAKPKKQNYQKQVKYLKRNFLLLGLERLSYTYKKLLLRHEFSIILIQKVISRLKPMVLGILLVRSLVS